jgi:hypothetical protein
LGIKSFGEGRGRGGDSWNEEKVNYFSLDTPITVLDSSYSAMSVSIKMFIWFL